MEYLEGGSLSQRLGDGTLEITEEQIYQSQGGKGYVLLGEIQKVDTSGLKFSKDREGRSFLRTESQEFKVSANGAIDGVPPDQLNHFWLDVVMLPLAEWAMGTIYEAVGNTDQARPHLEFVATKAPETFFGKEAAGRLGR